MAIVRMGVPLRQIETSPCDSSECYNSGESVVSGETGDSGKSRESGEFSEFVIVLYGMICIDTAAVTDVTLVLGRVKNGTGTL